MRQQEHCKARHGWVASLGWGEHGRRHSGRSQQADETAANLGALVGDKGHAPVAAVLHPRLLRGQLDEQQAEAVQVCRQGAAVAEDLLRRCRPAAGQPGAGTVS